MVPILFQIGSVTVYTYGVVTALGFLAAVITFTRYALRSKLPLEFISDHFLGLVFYTLVGARAMFVLSNWGLYQDNLMDILAVWRDGFSIWGGIAGFLLAFVVMSSARKEKAGKWMDALIPAGIMGLLFENIASFLDGSRYGSPTELPWGVTFENPEVRFTIPIHPIQLYMVVGILAILLLLPLLKAGKRGDGFVGVTALAGIVILSFFIGFLDASEETFAMGMAGEQWLQLGIAIICFAVSFTISQRRVESESPSLPSV